MFVCCKEPWTLVNIWLIVMSDEIAAQHVSVSTWNCWVLLLIHTPKIIKIIWTEIRIHSAH
jgi:hypothetical protein